MTVTAPSADAAPDTHRVYRVVQWAAGRIGLSAMRAIIRIPVWTSTSRTTAGGYWSGATLPSPIPRRQPSPVRPRLLR